MKTMKRQARACTVLLLASFAGHAGMESGQATAEDLAHQNQLLREHTAGLGFGPQAPRDLTVRIGTNKRRFSEAPPYRDMNLCNIHFHHNAEHRGGQFKTFAGYGDGHGFHSGYVSDGKLSAAETAALPAPVCNSEHGGLNAGDTIEVHYVHSTADVHPGETLSACLEEHDQNPQLRVEAQVMVLVNDPRAADFTHLTEVGEAHGYQQAVHLPRNTGRPIHYIGSTTGPKYDEQGSPLQVSWSVHPRVIKVNAASVGAWCAGNVFHEDHAHGVRNLVTDPELLSEIH